MDDADAGGAPPPGNEETVLLLPAGDVADPEVSIVIPALDEEGLIADFIDWCHEGIEGAGVAAEILIVDSSSDRTGDIALAKGARVLKTPQRGLGRAYIDAVGVIRGKYVICGDADCTYDFRRIEPFVEKLRQGYDYVMGSRFAGSIEEGAMPPLHRYFGTPLTTFLLNLIYGTRFTDIHCGMRGMTLDALKDMDLKSQSWEYASEMIVKAVRLKLKTAEVPVSFYKDRPGRLSHHKRIGWHSPWVAGWINLGAMLVHGADFFVLKPGVVLFLKPGVVLFFLGLLITLPLAAGPLTIGGVTFSLNTMVLGGSLSIIGLQCIFLGFLGLLITLPLAAGPLTIGGVTFSLNTMVLGGSLSIIGLQCIFLGCMAESIYDPSGAARARWLLVFAYTPVMAVCGVLFLAGLGLA